ncbi:MAG: hypothetical protein JW953_13185 [Anaerolineae bacterium]|nr:hypothetical protein [Anaerolineae bacterium]
MTQTKFKKSYLGLFLIVGTLITLFLILLTAMAIFILTRRSNAAEFGGQSLLTDTAPLKMIEVKQVDPALALASLGGVPEAEVITEAINKERPETALAALLFQPTLNDKESVGNFLLLASAYQVDEQKEKAIFSYQMAGTIATLSPNLPDTARADIFLQTGEGLIDLAEPTLAKFYLDQALLVAARSPFLQAAHRRSILERLQKNYIILEERNLARKSLDLSANPPALALLPEAVTHLPQGVPVPLPEPVQAAETNRWLRAQELAALLVERGGHAPPSAITALQEALLAEDNQKLPFYDTELAAETQVSKKIGLTLAKIEWLAIKYRIARRTYGLSIVPAWENQAEQIRADLTKTYETLFALYADYIVALPEASQIDRATEERLRDEVLAGELGRYPNYPEEQRKKQLLDTSTKLMTTQPELNIFIGVKTVSNQELYTLQAAE